MPHLHPCSIHLHTGEKKPKGTIKGHGRIGPIQTVPEIHIVEGDTVLIRERQGEASTARVCVRRKVERGEAGRSIGIIIHVEI
jgi:hypothetical protein